MTSLISQNIGFISNVPIKNRFTFLILTFNFAKFIFNQNDSGDTVIKKVSDSNNNINVSNKFNNKSNNFNNKIN